MADRRRSTSGRRRRSARRTSIAGETRVPGLNFVVDLSHHNATVSFEKARADGIVGVIHKATEGRAFVDPLYAGRRERAREAGLLWGAYHFGTGSAGVEQADHFLATVRPDEQTLLALDFEANPQGPSMSLEEARAFVKHVFEETGRWPGFYSGHYITEVLGSGSEPVLKRCWFWLSRYGATPVVPPNWATWTMWQYTDGAAGPEPHTVAGIGRCDRDTFNGRLARLEKLWGVRRAGASALSGARRASRSVRSRPPPRRSG